MTAEWTERDELDRADRRRLWVHDQERHKELAMRDEENRDGGKDEGNTKDQHHE